jgi:hypothetical protein
MMSQKLLDILQFILCDNLRCAHLKYSLHALVDKYDGETASATQVLINQNRLNWLLKYDATKNNFTKVNDNLYQYNDADFHGILIKRKDGLWALYYDIKQFYNVTQGDFWQSIGDAFKNKYDAQINQASQKKDDATKERKEIEKTIKDFWEAAKPLFDKNKSKQNTDLANAGSNYKGYLPVMGLTNPFSSFSNDLEYKNAVTGDYDLYAIWPKVPSKDDERVAGMFKDLEDKALIKAEGKSPIGELVGNISNRIYLLAQMINSLIPSPTGKSPNRIFHSDECGRPFVDEVDSAVAFSPQGNTFLIENAQDLANMVKYFKQEGYTCFINKGWLKDLKTHGVAENQVSWSDKF